jgi:hypothetical protein
LGTGHGAEEGSIPEAEHAAIAGDGPITLFGRCTARFGGRGGRQGEHDGRQDGRGGEGDTSDQSRAEFVPTHVEFPSMVSFEAMIFGTKTWRLPTESREELDGTAQQSHQGPERRFITANKSCQHSQRNTLVKAAITNVYTPNTSGQRRHNERSIAPKQTAAN